MSLEESFELIKNSFKNIKIELNETQVRQFYTYYQLLIEKNKVINLTAITDFKEVVLKHFVDSCFYINNYLNKNNINKTLIDVGTGAGFPGIPIKIVHPELKVTLLDSLNKRILFLNDVIRELQLQNVCTVHYRAEDGARDQELRENFDFVVSRAVANLSTLAEYCIPYVKKNGYFISFKSGNAEEEINAAKKAIYLLGGKIEETMTGTLPDSDISRTIIMIKKQENTSKKYPRKAGTPAKQPLT